MKNYAFNITSQERLVLIFLTTLALLGLSINLASKYISPIKNLSKYSFSERDTILKPKLDVNKASDSALVELPGIGPAIASRIIQYRETHGGFGSLEELKYVNGIGDKKLKELEKFLAVNRVNKP